MFTNLLKNGLTASSFQHNSHRKSSNFIRVPISIKNRAEIVKRHFRTQARDFVGVQSNTVKRLTGAWRTYGVFDSGTSTFHFTRGYRV